jgi:hypothetical protein
MAEPAGGPARQPWRPGQGAAYLCARLLDYADDAGVVSMDVLRAHYASIEPGHCRRASTKRLCDCLRRLVRDGLVTWDRNADIVVVVDLDVLRRHGQASLGRHLHLVEWQVRYRRAGWRYIHARVFQSEPPARRYAARLAQAVPAHRPWAPIVELSVECRTVGPWQPADQQ